MKLIRNNSPFTCVVCGKHVEKAVGSSRDHCPFCITSLHVDLQVPGDRMNECQGIMLATRIRYWKKDKYKVLFRCEKCRAEQWNITATDDSTEILAQLVLKTNESVMEGN